jgi:TonB family protein
VAAHFSEEARSAGKGGVVTLSVIINSKGKVAAAVPITGSEYGLDAQARDAVRTWRFTPPTCQGKPVNTTNDGGSGVQFKISFNSPPNSVILRGRALGYGGNLLRIT